MTDNAVVLVARMHGYAWWLLPCCGSTYTTAPQDAETVTCWQCDRVYAATMTPDIEPVEVPQ